MPERLRLVLIVLVACGLSGGAAAWLATRGDGAPAVHDETGAGWAGALRPPGAQVPEFALRDADGRVVRPPAEVAVYTFIYATCEETCPLQVQQIRGALDRVGRDVPVIGVSVDPVNDTRARARSFLLEQHMRGRMRFALGRREELAPVWRAFGIAPQTDELEHSAYVVLADARRRQRVGFPFGQLTVDGLADDLERLLAGA